MMLAGLIGVLAVGGILAWLGASISRDWPRWVALAAIGLDLILAIGVWANPSGPLQPSHGAWIAEASYAWIPRFGISFHLGLDGLSIVLVFLTLLLGIVAIAAPWREIQEHVGFFHFNVLWTLAGVLGVFMALDLFLFFLFWEAMLVPMYFIIFIWGHENRIYAAIKFFLFTQGSGLLMLVSILALALAHRGNTQTLSFDYFDLLGTAGEGDLWFWMMLGFFIAFAVKLPMVPFHTWLPDAHTEAPTAGSVILAGILLKTGAYGLIRFVVPLFPSAAASFAPVAMALGVLGILYGAILSFAQTDMKRLVAYSSISHLGFVLVGTFAWNAIALQGVVMQMLAHGVSTGALFVIAGAVQERLHTRDMRQMGGLWANVPRIGAIALFFAIASLGLPGLGNFIGEFLVLLGTYGTHPGVAALAALGLVGAAIYALALIQRTFHGAPRLVRAIPDLAGGPLAVMAAMMVAAIWLGLYPQPVLDSVTPALETLKVQPSQQASEEAYLAGR